MNVLTGRKITIADLGGGHAKASAPPPEPPPPEPPPHGKRIQNGILFVATSPPEPTPPESTSQARRDLKWQATNALLTDLVELYDVFDALQPKPLAIGIYTVILADLGCDPALLSHAWPTGSASHGTLPPCAAMMSATAWTASRVARSPSNSACMPARCYGGAVRLGNGVDHYSGN
jgi:hypothetical protein